MCVDSWGSVINDRDKRHRIQLHDSSSLSINTSQFAYQARKVMEDVPGSVTQCYTECLSSIHEALSLIFSTQRGEDPKIMTTRKDKNTQGRLKDYLAYKAVQGRGYSSVVSVCLNVLGSEFDSQRYIKPAWRLERWLIE